MSAYSNINVDTAVPHNKAHSGCVGGDSHDALYPDLSRFQSLRRGSVGPVTEAIRRNSCDGFSTCGRRASLRHIKFGELEKRQNDKPAELGADFDHVLGGVRQLIVVSCPIQSVDKPDASLCSCEVKKSEAARELARVFNRTAQNRNVYLRFAATYWALMDEVSRLKTIFFSGERPLSSKEAVLFEDDVRMDGDRPNKMRRLCSFMDARGRHGNSRATELEAFMHFSYHESGGRLVICGLEGVHDSEGFYLKTPTIHSRAREFGNNDGGFPAIREVFRHHVCNNVCKDMHKPAQEEEGCESEEQFPIITECATSGLPGPFSENKEAATSSCCTTHELSTQNSQLSQISSFSDSSNSESRREVPSAPELPKECHDLSRSISCPSSQFASPDSWAPRDDRSAFLPPSRLQQKPRASFMHQNSLPNTMLATTLQTHGATSRGDPTNIHSATSYMVDLHIQDENANPRMLSYSSHASDQKPHTDRSDQEGNTQGTTGSAIPNPITQNETSRHFGASDRPLPGDSMLCESRDRQRQVPEHCASRDPNSGDHPCLAHGLTSESPCFRGAPLSLPEAPPSYLDSQIAATACWVMQHGYGHIPAPAPPTQVINPFEQQPRQQQGCFSPHCTGNTNHYM
ncbi:hypothetical protein EGW08_000211 [Elysia chlorotica]|uniref:Alpha-type protein kinase domain-containing protein n=1 Tax=Elysia chlorotica TaxID=188477 RepID=A0A3S1A291_ELYCH|nr:hypothetical protein EGW08_000211 [Elysia chlorotica]